MTAPTLRPYQQLVVDRSTLSIANGVRRILLVAPTGAGKTVIAASTIAEPVRQGQRGLFMALGGN